MDHLPVTPRTMLNIGAITANRMRKGRWVARLTGTNLAWTGESAFVAVSRARQYQASQPHAQCQAVMA